MYHMDPNLVCVGFVMGLDYENPYTTPYKELQKFKTHPMVKDIIDIIIALINFTYILFLIEITHSYRRYMHILWCQSHQ